MRRRQFALVVLGALALSTPALAGKAKKHPAPAPTPTPEAQPSPASTADVMPAERLQSFLDAHLDKILAPLDAEGLKHPNLIIDFKNSLADAMSKAPAAKQPAFQAAIGVCDALVNALNERQVAAANIGGLSSAKSSSSLGVVSRPGHLSWEQIHSEARARQEAAQTDATFINSAKSQWVQRAGQLRQGIEQLYSRERDIERQISAAAQTNALADARREAIRRYPDLAVEGSKLNAAYVARYDDY